MLVMLLLNLYTSRIVLDKLGIVDYGIYNVVGSLVLLFTFVQGSLASSASRFFSYEIGSGTSQSLNNVFCMSMNIHIIFSVVILLLSETFGIWYFYKMMVIPVERQQAAYITYQLSCLSAIFNILVIPYRAMVIANEKMKVFAYISIIEAFLYLFIAYCLFYNNIDRLILYGTLLFIVKVLIMILYVTYCKMYFIESKFTCFWDKNILKEMSIFSGWSICSYISTGAVSQSYNLFLNLFFGPTVNAARAVSYQVQSAVYQFVNSFQTAVNPQIIKNFAIHDNNRVYELIMLSSKFSFCLLFIIFTPLLINVDFILSFWLTEVPQYTNSFILIIAFSSMFMAFANPLSVVAEAANKLKLYNLITLPIYVISVIISYIYLAHGATVFTVFYMTLFVELIIYFFKLYVFNKIIIISMTKHVILYFKCVISVFILFLLICIVNNYTKPSFMYFLLLSFGGLLFSLLWIYCYILSRPERKFVILKISSFILKKNE